MPDVANIPAPTRSTFPRRTTRSTNLVALSIAASLLASGCSQQTTALTGPAQQAPDGRVEAQVFALQIGSGGGSLFYGGRAYRFIISGLGVASPESPSMIDIDGDVYHLSGTAAFPGAYSRSDALGGSGGDLWLQNHDNVLVHLFAKRPGFTLSVGGDIVAITPG